MSLTLPAVLFQLPSVRRFFSVLADDLANRRSLLILLPAGIEPEEIWAALRAELWRRDFTVEEVSLAGVPRERAPVAVLSEALGINWTPPDTPRTLGNLLATEQLPDVVLVEHLDQVSPRNLSGLGRLSEPMDSGLPDQIGPWRLLYGPVHGRAGGRCAPSAPGEQCVSGRALVVGIPFRIGDAYALPLQ